MPDPTSVTVTTGSLGATPCYTNFQAMYEAFMDATTWSVEIGGLGVLVQAGTPTASEQDLPWLKLDGTGAPLGWYKYQGSWLRVPDQSYYGGTSTGSSNAYVIALDETPALSSLVGKSISFIANHNCSGAATLQVGSETAKAITKNGVIELVTGDIVTNQLITVVYDGTRFQLAGNVSTIKSTDLITTFTADDQDLPSGRAETVTFQHGLDGKPDIVNAYLIRASDGSGYLIGDMIPISLVVSQATGDTETGTWLPTYVVIANEDSIIVHHTSLGYPSDVVSYISSYHANEGAVTYNVSEWKLKVSAMKFPVVE